MTPRPFLCGVLLFAPVALPAAAQSFQAEGSDTGAGIGPRYVALGGAGSAMVTTCTRST